MTAAIALYNDTDGRTKMRKETQAVYRTMQLRL